MPGSALSCVALACRSRDILLKRFSQLFGSATEAYIPWSSAPLVRFLVHTMHCIAAKRQTLMPADTQEQSK